MVPFQPLSDQGWRILPYISKEELEIVELFVYKTALDKAFQV